MTQWGRDMFVTPGVGWSTATWSPRYGEDQTSASAILLAAPITTTGRNGKLFVGEGIRGHPAIRAIPWTDTLRTAERNFKEQYPGCDVARGTTTPHRQAPGTDQGGEAEHASAILRRLQNRRSWWTSGTSRPPEQRQDLLDQDRLLTRWS